MPCVLHSNSLVVVQLGFVVSDKAMGQSQSQSNSLARRKPNPDDYKYYVEWEGERFAEGRFRYAIRGTWVRPKEKQDQQCVVKHLKSSYTWNKTDWDTTVKIYKEAEELAKGFNTFSKTNNPIHFTEVVVIKCLYKENPNSLEGPRLDEYCTTEDYLAGNFKKWVNNYGMYSEETLSTAISMPAFMHWSWYHTKGEKMIADLQGIRDSNGYTLTDPVILSLSGEYGATDMGVEGMAIFFYLHKCNSFCEKLPRPDQNIIKSQIPHAELQSCIRMTRTVQLQQMATTYSCELRLSVQVRVQLVIKFRAIAAKDIRN